MEKKEKNDTQNENDMKIQKPTLPKLKTTFYTKYHPSSPRLAASLTLNIMGPDLIITMWLDFIIIIPIILVGCLGGGRAGTRDYLKVEQGSRIREYSPRPN